MQGIGRDSFFLFFLSHVQSGNMLLFLTEAEERRLTNVLIMFLFS